MATNYTKNKYLHYDVPLLYRLQGILYHLVPYLKVISGMNLKLMFFLFGTMNILQFKKKI